MSLSEARSASDEPIFVTSHLLTTPNLVFVLIAPSLSPSPSFIDLNNHVLNLGLTIDMAKYIDGQPITIYLLGHHSTPLTRGNTLSFMHSLARRKSLTHSRKTSVSGPDKRDLPPRKDEERARKWWDSVKVFCVVEFKLVDA